MERQAQQHSQEQKPQLAIPLLEKVVALDPDNVNAQVSVGVLLYFQNSCAQAVPHMRAALRLRGDLPRIEALPGMAEKRMGEPREALPHLERSFAHLDET